MSASSNRLQRVVVAATAACVVLLLGLVTLSRAPVEGSNVELEQLKAAARQPARHVCVDMRIVLLQHASLAFTRAQVPRLFLVSERRFFVFR